MPSEPDVARRELLGFAAQLLPALPLEIKIGVQATGLPGVIHIASKSHTRATPSASAICGAICGAICSAICSDGSGGSNGSNGSDGRDARWLDGVWFDGDELRALAVAAQTERIWASDFKGYCLRKLHDPSFRVTEATALAGAQPDTEPAWSLSRVLHWLELDLVAIEVATQVATELATEVATETVRAPDAAAA